MFIAEGASCPRRARVRHERGCSRDPEQGKASPASGSPAASAAAPAPMAVTTISVQPKRVPIVIEAVGQATGSRQVEVRARVSGILEKRLFEEGSRVRQGAVL